MFLVDLFSVLFGFELYILHRRLSFCKYCYKTLAIDKHKLLERCFGKEISLSPAFLSNGSLPLKSVSQSKKVLIDLNFRFKI